MENHHFQWENSLQMAIFNSYVSLPEGIYIYYTIHLINWFSTPHLCQPLQRPLLLHRSLVLSLPPLLLLLGIYHEKLEHHGDVMILMGISLIFQTRKTCWVLFFQSIIVASNKLTIYIYIMCIYIYIHYVYIYIHYVCMYTYIHCVCIYIYRPFRGGWIDYVESYEKNCEDIYYTIQFGGVIIFSNPHLYAYINCMCIYICIYIYVYIYVYIYIYMFGIQIMTQDEDTVNVPIHCPCRPTLPFFTWETRAN